MKRPLRDTQTWRDAFKWIATKLHNTSLSFSSSSDIAICRKLEQLGFMHCKDQLFVARNQRSNND